MTTVTTSRWSNEGRLTPETIAEYRQRIGKSFSTEKRGRLRTASPDAVRAFALSIGDDNPLWVSASHGNATRWRRQIAPPSILYAVFLGEVMSGLPGVHAFHSGCSWEFFKPVSAGDVLRATCTFLAVDERSSDFAPLWLIGTYESVYYNQHEEVVAKVRSTQIRVERRAMRSGSANDRSKAMRTVPHPWTPEDLKALEQAMIAQAPEPGPRFFEDVSVGDTLPTLVKGPLRQTDVVAWLSATEILRSTNAGLREIARHPGLGLLAAASNARESIESVHWDNESARSAGVPGAYDLGAQRQAFQIQSITDWAGDESFLLSNSCEYRKFVFLGDALRFVGKVVRKYVSDDLECCVEIDSATLNQHGEDVMPARSIVVLPSRENDQWPADRRQAGAA